MLEISQCPCNQGRLTHQILLTAYFQVKQFQVIRLCVCVHVCVCACARVLTYVLQVINSLYVIGASSIIADIPCILPMLL